jgi:hypothetical protein
MKKSLIFSFGLIGEVGFATALPLVIFGKLGKYLDQRWETTPYLFYAGVALASLQIFLYLRMIVKKASEDFQKIDD